MYDKNPFFNPSGQMSVLSNTMSVMEGIGEDPVPQ